MGCTKIFHIDDDADDIEFFEQFKLILINQAYKVRCIYEVPSGAKDGFEALMSCKDKVISGLKIKAMIGMSNILPDTAVASMMDKQQKPAADQSAST